MVPRAIHGDDAEQPVLEDQRARHRPPHAEIEPALERDARLRVVVHDQSAALVGAGADDAVPEGDGDVPEPAALGPRAGHQQAIALDDVDDAAGLEQTRGALDDQREQTRGVELGRQLALGLGQRRDLRAARRLEREQPRVLQRQRGLVGDRLEQRRLRRGEDAAGRIAEVQRTDDPSLRPERHRQDGGVAGASHRRPQLVGHDEGGIREDIG